MKKAVQAQSLERQNIYLCCGAVTGICRFHRCSQEFFFCWYTTQISLTFPLLSTKKRSHQKATPQCYSTFQTIRHYYFGNRAPKIRLISSTVNPFSWSIVSVRANNYQDVANSAMDCLDNGFESAMTVMILPKGMQRYYRTSNHIERVNKELKRRSKVIGIFPNEASLVRLMGSVLIEENARNLCSRKIFSKESYAELIRSDVKAKLIIIAKEQEALLAA